MTAPAIKTYLDELAHDRFIAAARATVARDKFIEKRDTYEAQRARGITATSTLVNMESARLAYHAAIGQLQTITELHAVEKARLEVAA